ncbi:MAG: conjugal transfer protein TraX [Firmicutes bacterium]|nr:conjugal transfer protein TraX [Bacillota bacterium]
MSARRWELTSAQLHIIAMAAMLLDHLWAAGLLNSQLFTCIGRLAFPLFAFMIAEGFHYTRSRKRYAQRLLFWALLTEVPFNLMLSGSAFYPIHQNAIWTLLLGLLSIWAIDALRQKDGLLWLIAAPIIGMLGFVLGFVLMTDYFGAGVLMVVCFYLFRGRKWWCFAGQLLLLYWLNVEVLAGLVYPLQLGGLQLELPQQGIALLALLPIWLYRGEKGHSSRAFKLFCYAFYPLHMLLIYLCGIIF